MFASCQYKYNTYYICMSICARQSYYAHICTYVAVQFYIIFHLLTYKSIDTLAYIYAHIAFHFLASCFTFPHFASQTGFKFP